VAARRTIARKLRSSAALLRGVLALLAALVAAGCAIAPPPPRAAIPPPARRAVELLAARAREFTDMRTLADVSVQRGGERYRLRGVILAKAPSSVRFEALSPLGPPLMVATIHDGQITAYDSTTDEVTTGPATAEAAARLLSLPFEPDDLVGVLSGRPVPPRDLREVEILAPDAAGPSINMVGAVNSVRVWMDFDTGLAKQMEIAGGRGDARIVFRREGSDAAMGGFELTAGMGLIKTSVRYDRPAFGAGIEPDRFVFAPPKSAKSRTIR
jgi:outer membrane lipoprotein-sorting protein